MKEKRKHTKKNKLSYANINYKEQQMQIRKPLLSTWSPTYNMISIYQLH